MSAPVYRIVIVGAAHEGAQAALNLRQLGFEGEIIMIGRELGRSHRRLPLPKEYLPGDHLMPQELRADQHITVKLGASVVRVDTQQKTVGLDNGDAINFDALIWAAGRDARGLVYPIHDLNQGRYQAYHDLDRERRA